MGSTIDCEECDQVYNQNQNTANSSLTVQSQRQKIEVRPIKQTLAKSLKSETEVLKLKDGNFKVLYQGGECYQGQMVNNMRHGFGVQYFDGGLQYNGMWQFDKGKGHGILKKKDFQLQGEFDNNMIVNGKMKVLNGRFTEIYQGSFKDFKYHGKGVLNIVGHSIYEGEFVFHKKQGKGKITYASGCSYEGEFVNGNIEGLGIFRNRQFQYKGEFKMNKIHGKGTCKWNNGNVYIGQFVNGLRQGRGQFFNGNTTIYSGLWRKGKPYDLSFTFGKQNGPKAKVSI